MICEDLTAVGQGGCGPVETCRNSYVRLTFGMSTLACLFTFLLQLLRVSCGPVIIPKTRSLKTSICAWQFHSSQRGLSAYGLLVLSHCADDNHAEYYSVRRAFFSLQPLCHPLLVHVNARLLLLSFFYSSICRSFQESMICHSGVSSDMRHSTNARNDDEGAKAHTLVSRCITSPFLVFTQRII